jgi:ABC-type amino acid transport system permease subunit
VPIVLLLVIMIKKIFKVDNTWAFILFFLIAYMVFKIRTGEEYLKAFNYIIPGLRITFGSTLVSFVIALFLGLIIKFLALYPAHILSLLEVFLS